MNRHLARGGLRRWKTTRGAIRALALLLFVLPGCAGGGGEPVGVAPRATDGAWWEGNGPVEEGVAPRYQGFTRESHYLEMRDGVRIAVEVWVPTGAPGETFPALLEQTRYWRAREIRAPFRWLGVRDPIFELFVEPFLERGYARVVVDVRGSGASFGVRDREFSDDEILDGIEVVDWIVDQPWSDGQVGTIGISYGGYTAELLAGAGHPAVRAAALLFSGWDIYADIGFPGGLHLSWFSENWGRMNDMLDRNDLSPILDWRGRLALSGVARVDGDRRGRLLRAAIREREGSYDIHGSLGGVAFRDDPSAEGWRFDDLSPFARPGEGGGAVVPFYHYTGWFDGGYARAAIHRFLSRDHPEDRLTIGPWNHGGEQNASEFSPSEDPAFPHVEELVRFFDLHLKGRDHGFTSEPRVHYFTLGEESWKAAPTWPPAGTQAETLYLGPGGALVSEGVWGGAGPSPTAFVDNWRVDPELGTGRLTRWSSLMGGHVHYPDRASLEGRVLGYTTDPLPEAIEVTGHPVVSIHLSVPATDAAVFVYLEDVLPDGRVRYVTEGQLRAIHRAVVGPDLAPYSTVGPFRSFERADARPLRPDVPTELRFDLLPTSYRFGAGHRIRVSVAAGDANFFAPIPEATDLLRVHGGSLHPSRIELPVMVGSPGIAP